ncbi:MAG TPA: S8 family serine peptidase, partial [Acidobacteriaceae bacterium]|nr:S8 family serine peptidase [Acidobacteriaceae bacterium]
MLRRLILFTFMAAVAARISAQPQAALPVSPPIPGRLLIVYRSRTIPANADSLARAAGAHALHHFRHLGVTALSVAPADEPHALAQLAANPQVALVLHDRYVTGHSIHFSRLPLALPLDAGDPTTSGSGTSSTITRHSVARAPIKPRTDPAPSGNSNSTSTSTSGDNPPQPTTDIDYDSAQGWAVRAAGGYGDSIPGGVAAGPWNTSLGAGIRIAILDSGVDANHPDITPNLALNLSEINQTALPSPCDDGSAQDQSGHGTWTASLAAGALGPGTGNVIGVAPQATILNIKVLERMPASGIANIAQACEAGEPGGLLSWVLQGIDDAVANHADIIA